MTRIAVTGADGFIGRHLVAELANRSVDITAVGRQGRPASGPAGICQRVEIDLHDPPRDAFVRMGRPDVLVHLAWGGLPNYRSLHHFEHELPGHYRFLRDLVLAGLPALVATGTCFEYGMQSGPLAEDTPTQPANPYGLAKDMLRRQLEFLRGEQPFALTWARLFYLYGDGQSETSLLPQLRRAATGGDAIFRMSGGEQLRDYLPIHEAARILATLAIAQLDVGVINVCAGKPISVRALVESWIASNGWNIGLELGAYPYPTYEPLAFWGTNTKLTQTLQAAR